MISRLALATCGLVVASMAIMSLRADDTKLAPEKVVSVINEVEGTTTIRSLVPAGTQVKKGQLICELDSAPLRDRLNNQEIEIVQAKANLENAQRARNVTKLAVEETKAVLQLNDESARGVLAIAMSDQAAASDRLNGTPVVQVIAAKRELQRAEVALRKAKGEWELLQNYTKLRRTTECEAALKKAESDDFAMQSAYERSVSLEKKLRHQIELCKLRAPIDGKLVYPQSENSLVA